jgi:hypothetical protein
VIGHGCKRGRLDAERATPVVGRRDPVLTRTCGRAPWRVRLVVT